MKSSGKISQYILHWTLTLSLCTTGLRVLLSNFPWEELHDWHQRCQRDRGSLWGGFLFDKGRVPKNVVIFHGHKTKLCSYLWFWAQGLVKILKLMLRRDLEAELWSVFCCRYLIEVTKLNLGQDSEARFDQDFKFFSRDSDVWLWFWS